MKIRSTIKYGFNDDRYPYWFSIMIAFEIDISVSYSSQHSRRYFRHSSFCCHCWLYFWLDFYLSVWSFININTVSFFLLNYELLLLLLAQGKVTIKQGQWRSIQLKWHNNMSSVAYCLYMVLLKVRKLMRMWLRKEMYNYMKSALPK